MEELKFDTGRVSYEINGVPDALAFNPTDANFVCRLMDFLESTGEKHAEFFPGGVRDDPEGLRGAESTLAAGRGGISNGRRHHSDQHKN